MATLMDFAAMQLERDAYSSRADFGEPEEDPNISAPPILHFGSHIRKDFAADGCLHTPLLVIGVHGFGSDVLKASIKTEEWEEVGCLLLPEISLKGCTFEAGFRDGVCTIWRSCFARDEGGGKSQAIFAVHASQKVPLHRANLWAATLLSSISACRLLVLDGVNTYEVGSRLSEDPFAFGEPQVPIRVLRTHGAPRLTSHTAAPDSTIAKIPTLETGTVVTGIAAALLTRRTLNSPSSPAAAAILGLLPDHSSAAARAARAALYAGFCEAAEAAVTPPAAAAAAADRLLLPEELAIRAVAAAAARAGSSLYT